ncbi:MAG: serine/threonine protein kinase, partial [Parascardovia denticolens]
EEGDDTERKNEEDEPSDAQTAVLSSSALPGSTRIMPAQAWPRMTMHGDDEDTGDEDSTADCDDAGSETSDTSETGETEPLLTATRIMPAAAPLGRTTPTTQVMPVNQAMPAMSQTQVMPPIPGQPLPFIPAAAANQTQAPDQPPVVPADSVLYWYRRHSLLPLILTTIPLTFFAMAAPLVTFFLAILLFWVFAAIGYNAQARERRREKKGNVFTKSDSAITGLAFPLRLLKAIPAALGAGVIMGIIWSAFLLLIVLLIGSAGGGSHVHATISLFSTTFSVPLPSGDLTSPETIALGLSFAFSWMCGLLSHTATMVRVGFGSTRTAKIPGYPRGEGLAPKTVAALFCLVALIFLTVSYCASGFLNWTPLPVSY